MDTPTLEQIFQNVTSSNWKMVAALGVILVVQLLKTDRAKQLFPFITSGWRAFVAAVVLASMGGAANAYAAGHHAAAEILQAAVQGAQVGFMAAGGWSGLQAFLKAKSEKAATPPPPPAK